MTPSDQWRYTDDDGVQRLVDVDELRAALADGRLKPGILVWRRGMKQWLPAASVPELAPNSPISAAAQASAHVQIGAIVAPTPSVPPPAVAVVPEGPTPGTPENIVDINELQALSERRRKETTQGVGPQGAQPAAAKPAEQAAAAPAASAPEGNAIPQAPRLPTINIPATSSSADARENAAAAGRPRRVTRVGGFWSSSEARREVEETTTTLVRGEGSLAGAPPVAELGDGAKTAVREDTRGPAMAVDDSNAATRALGLRAPAAQSGVERKGTAASSAAKSAPATVAGGPGTGLPTRSRRTSRPPPPPAKAAASPSPATGERSGRAGERPSAPPPPLHRSRRRVSGRPAPGAAADGAASSAPQGSGGGVGASSAPGAQAARAATSNVYAGAGGLQQSTGLPASKLGPGGPAGGDEATAVAIPPGARQPASLDGATAARAQPPSSSSPEPRTLVRPDPMPAQTPGGALPEAAMPMPAAGPANEPAGSQSMPTAELPVGLGASMAALGQTPGGAAYAQPSAVATTGSNGGFADAGRAPASSNRSPALPPTGELPAYGYAAPVPDSSLLELRPVPPAPPSASTLGTTELPRSSMAEAPPPWAAGAAAPPEAPARDSWPRVPAKRELSTTALTIRLSALISAAVVVGLLLASSFLVGRLTAPAQSGLAEVVRARTGFTTVPLFARSKTAQASSPRPCLMLRAPAQWAEAASKNIPFEVAATPGGKLAIGYAIGTKQVQGLTVDADTGVIEEAFAPDPGEDELSRVVPIIDAEGKVLYAETPIERGGVRNAVWAAALKPFIVGFKDDACVALDSVEAEPQLLWKLDPTGTPDALRTVRVTGRGVAVAYRHDSRSWYAWLNEDRSVGVAPTAVSEAAAEVGKPMIASNGEAVSLVYADRTAAGEPAVIRWARGPVGKPLGKPEVVELPPGGPGGDAIAPAIAGLTGGRWVLMWTEGSRGKQRMLRAQTFARDGQRIGEALQVSPATGSFGQGTVGVEGESAAVVFLLQRRLGYQVRYELWGTVLQCQ